MAQVGRLLKCWRSEEGAQLVEFALVLPLLLLVMLGIADFGFMFQRYEVVTNAAREGARLAVLPGYGTPDGIQTVRARVAAYLSSGRVPVTSTNPIITVDSPPPISLGIGQPTISVKRVTVTYTYTYQFLNALAAFFGSHAALPMTAVAEMRTEGS